MGAFGKCKGGGRRVAARNKNPAIAIVTTLTGSQSAIILDISSTGAQVRGRDLPIKGDDLFVSIEGVLAFGTVAWSEGELRGIAFDEPLQPEAERKLRITVSQARGMAPELRAAMEDWSLGLAR